MCLYCAVVFCAGCVQIATRARRATVMAAARAKATASATMTDTRALTGSFGSVRFGSSSLTSFGHVTQIRMRSNMGDFLVPVSCDVQQPVSGGSLQQQL